MEISKKNVSNNRANAAIRGSCLLEVSEKDAVAIANLSINQKPTKDLLKGIGITGDIVITSANTSPSEKEGIAIVNLTWAMEWNLGDKLSLSS